MRQLQKCCADSNEYLSANPSHRELFVRLENFATLAVWPCVPAPKTYNKRSSAQRRPWSNPEDDIQRALFYGKAGLYQDAKEHLHRFLDYMLRQAAKATGAQIDNLRGESSSLDTLLAEDGFRPFDEALALRSRLKRWQADMVELDAELAECCILFFPSSLLKFTALAHEVIDLALTCSVYWKPQIMVSIEGTDAFGDYVRWAELLDHDEVEAVHGVLKPGTREHLLAYAEEHPTVTALRLYLKTAKPVANEDEFDPRFSEMMAYISQ
jgi:hypothetical protein